ncbi:hypothetical protein FRAHR75_290060 [Frankia sp. Hr75.2]|nr:hypothetical protein FRAHR75_290060 [Frankia sp. Hr75.2]
MVSERPWSSSPVRVRRARQATPARPPALTGSTYRPPSRCEARKVYIYYLDFAISRQAAGVNPPADGRTRVTPSRASADAPARSAGPDTGDVSARPARGLRRSTSAGRAAKGPRGQGSEGAIS